MDAEIVIIDLFCGAGGTTTGAHMVNDKIKVIACVNHDKNAIASHTANHPEAVHFIEDIRVLAMMQLKVLVAKIRQENPKCKVYIWASLECTNHSKAKGGLPRDADSRTLAEHLFRYIEAINPDKIWVENVTEFLIWGPLDDNGKPIPKDKGKDYRKWVNNVKKHGYNYEYQILNAKDFGAYTSRKRYFGQFYRWGSKSAWPKPTHGEGLKPYNPVKDVLDFDNEGTSIFNRKRPLVDATLRRIYHGLVKFVANGETVFIKRYNGGDPKEKSKSINNPIGSLSTSGRFAIVRSCFIGKYYGTGKNVESLEKPCGTLTTKDRFQFIQAQYGKSKSSSVDKPCGTITTNPKQNLVSGRFLMNPQFNSKGSSLESPCFTLIARMDKAPPYLIEAKMSPIMVNDEVLDLHNKLVNFMSDMDVISMYDEINDVYGPRIDSIKSKIALFMIQYGIIDIMMRMLEIEELLQIQGFPVDYTLIGTKTEKKKYIGNAVECNQAKAILQADYNSTIKLSA